MIRKIAVAMSGGVDSSVAAALLRRAGEDVIGVTMRLWGEESDSGPAVDSAAEVCRVIGIEHRVLDLREIFRQEIINYFLDSYVQALTPNPCVRCNQKIKFGT
ncbi:MAG: asparagine synthase-related protein, partial [Nitrospirota bacterium]